MNWRPWPFPTFFVPAGSKGGPPTLAPGVTAGAAAAATGAGEVSEEAGGAAPDPKPHRLKGGQDDPGILLSDFFHREAIAQGARSVLEFSSWELPVTRAATH